MEKRGLLCDFQVFGIREDVLDRLPPHVFEGVLEVSVWIEPVDDGRADYREQGDRVSGAGLAARGLENLPHEY